MNPSHACDCRKVEPDRKCPGPTAAVRLTVLVDLSPRPTTPSVPRAREWQTLRLSRECHSYMARTYGNDPRFRF